MLARRRARQCAALGFRRVRVFVTVEPETLSLRAPPPDRRPAAELRGPRVSRIFYAHVGDHASVHGRLRAPPARRRATSTPRRPSVGPLASQATRRRALPLIGGNDATRCSLQRPRSGRYPARTLHTRTERGRRAHCWDSRAKKPCPASRGATSAGAARRRSAGAQARAVATRSTRSTSRRPPEEQYLDPDKGFARRGILPLPRPRRRQGRHQVL